MQKKMSKGMLMAALICGSLSVLNVASAEEMQTFEMDEFVVTAARTETRLVDTPANISVVGAEQIEERKYQDVGEVLKDVDGVTVLDVGIGAQEKTIKLNGDDRVLVLVDGRRVGSEKGSASGGRASMDMNQLPDPSMIERVEVLKGAGGALYGSDAVGGVINIITKKADSTNGKLSLGFGSFGAEDKKIMYSAKEGKTGVIVSASQYEQDYYKYRDAKTDTTKRWFGDSDFKNEKISLNLNQEITDKTNLTIGYDYSKFEGNSPSYPFNHPYYTLYKQEKETQNIYVKYDWLVNGVDQGYVQFYRNELDYSNIGQATDLLKEKTNGIDVQQTFKTSDSNTIIVGASWRETDVKVTGANNYNESIENTAVFVSNNWEFVPTWTLNAGLRYDDHSYAGDETTMSAGLNKKIDEDSHIYFNWSEVFKAPNADNLFFYDPGSMMGYIYKGNPNLSPETGETWTIGYATKLNNRTNCSFNYFESELNDAIAYQQISNDTWEATNINEQKKRGMEISLNHEVNDNISVNASYTYLQVENNNFGTGYERDRNYYPNVYRVGLNYKDGKWDSNVWLRCASGCDTTVSTYSGDSNRYARYVDNNFITVDMAITYKASKDFSVYAKAYNIFNEAYTDSVNATNGSYNSPAQSRRFIIGAEYTF